MASAVNPITAATTTTPSTSSSSSSSGTPTEGMFLQLLVSQLQNQDPLNPTDSTQFVSQLAQISELEQVIGIRGDIETQMTDSGLTVPTSTANAATASTGNTDLVASSNNNTGATPANNQISS